MHLSFPFEMNVKRSEAEDAMNDPDRLTEAETTQRREEALKRMLNTPPQPHKKTAGQRKSQKGKAKPHQAKPKCSEA